MPHTLVKRLSGKGKGKPSPNRGAFTSRAASISEATWKEAFQYIDKNASDHGVFQKVLRDILRDNVTINSLKNRYKAGNSKVSRTGKKSWLPEEVETKLVTWCVMQQDASFCVKVVKLAEMAGKFGAALGIPITGGRKWVDGFFKRHPKIAARMGEVLDLNRLTSKARLMRWINLQRLMRLGPPPEMPANAVKPENQHNMDESGFDGQALRQAVVTLKERGRHPFTGKVKAKNLGHISIMFSVSATGACNVVTLIWKADKVDASWVKEWPEAYHIAEPSGFNNEDIMMAWFVRWELATRPKDPTERRILDGDNHFSHHGLDMLLYARAHNVDFIGMEPHTTHIVCVLDKGPFGSLKAHERRLMKALDYSPSKAEYAGILKRAFNAAMAITVDPVSGDRKSIARSCYEKIGLCPFNEGKLIALADLAEKGAVEFRKHVAAQLEAAGLPADAPRQRVELGPEERAELIADLEQRIKYPTLPKMPKVAVDYVEKHATRRQQSELLTGYAHLEAMALKKLEKEKELDDAAARKEERAAKKVVTAAAAAEKAVAKAARAEEKEAAAAAKLAKQAAKAAKAAKQAVAGPGGAFAGVGAAAAAPAEPEKRARGGSSAVDGAFRPAKRMRGAAAGEKN